MSQEKPVKDVVCCSGCGRDCVAQRGCKESFCFQCTGCGHFATELREERGRKSFKPLYKEACQ